MGVSVGVCVLTGAEPDEVSTEKQNKVEFSERDRVYEKVCGSQCLLQEDLPLSELTSALLCTHCIEFWYHLLAGREEQLIQRVWQDLRVCVCKREGEIEKLGEFYYRFSQLDIYTHSHLLHIPCTDKQSQLRERETSLQLCSSPAGPVSADRGSPPSLPQLAAQQGREA